MQDFNRGSIFKNYIIFTIPLLLGNLLQTGYSIVDTIFLGRVGADAIAAVSLSFALLFVLFSLSMGLSMGSTTLVAQYAGAKDKVLLNKAVKNSIAFSLLLGVFFSIGAVILSGPLIKLMGAPKEIEADALIYMRIFSAGIIFMYFFFLISAILRGLGDSKTPLKFMAVSTTVNIILDPILIFGLGPIPRLEVAGAALATVIAMACAAFYGLWYLNKKQEYFDLSFKDFKFDSEIIKHLLRLGLPAGVGQTINALGSTVVVRVVTYFGPVPLAVYGVGTKVDSLIMMPAMSMSIAAAAMVGQNIGANQIDRAKKTAVAGMLMLGCVLVVMAGLLAVFPFYAVRVFSNDPAIWQPGIEYIRILAVSYPFMAVIMVLGGAFRGAGAAMAAMVISIGSLWVVRVPLAVFLGINLNQGPSGIWWAVSLSWILGAVVSLAYFLKGKWYEKGVVKHDIESN
ncbi:MATE family efflux transporter [Desulfitibacter alkalitolerans]|uniref:MATE family efflux transporter n=1 Tax=Desulfitibacter alkalitolerans TaxID=264641 RepID=UPI000481DEF0|nr:MATE family efflux transporter [Desulfitibacter alkalitolerans]